ncbi:hypothetical protein GGR54DRAFT_223638 [Hypoxylon sp. NC1633]|nr:hypothetical protein GGR54DRAFT_223638 [Hypoxylon sp. NC1633]
MIAKLKENRVLSDEGMDMFKRELVLHYEADHSKEPNRELLQDRQRPQQEINDKFDRMYLYNFSDAVIYYMWNHVPNDRCVQVYEDVMSVVPNRLERPAAQEPNPREKPATPFSVSRAAPGSVKSNVELIDTFAASTNMAPKRAIYIRGLITWFDSHSEGRSGMWTLGYGRVSGGRLGRDHTLGDVPNNYVRDSVMDCIDTMYEGEQRENAMKAVFPDLSTSEIEQYRALIVQKREEDLRKERGPSQQEREEALSRVIGTRPMKSDSERKHATYQAELLLQIDDHVDLTPKPGFGFRDPTYPALFYRSVVYPRLDYPPLEEIGHKLGSDVDRDCDQIRAMIVRLTKTPGWTVDIFRWTLGVSTRQHLNRFLEKRGPKEGMKSTVYPLAWEFFKLREILGLRMTDDSGEGDKDVLRERDANSTKKRPSSSEKEHETRGKRTRKT